MKFHSAGEKSKAICESCAALRETTFAYRDVPFSDGSGVVKELLVGVCDHCGGVVQIPAQSIAAISKERAKATESLEAMFPAPYMELLDLACYTIDPEMPADLRKGLVLFYIHRFAEGAVDKRSLADMLEKLEGRTALKSDFRKRLSMKVPQRQDRELASIVASTGLKKTDVLRAVVGFIEFDIVEDRSPELVKQIREFSVLAAG